MKVVELTAYGEPSAVVRVVERPDPPAPGPGEVAVDMLASSINPSDLLLCRGLYGVTLPPLPHVPGAEGVGRVTAVGPGVSGLAVGDLVAPVTRGCWVEKATLPAHAALRLPPGTDVLQAAMLRANPATAEAMLSDIVALQPGDVVMQNAANSAVGTFVCRLAALKGLRTLNVVRREGARAAVEAAGGTWVVVDELVSGKDFAARVAEITGGARPKLAFDAIGGKATGVLAAALADGGTVVNYGLLSGEPCRIGPAELVFREITLRGFWLPLWFRDAGRAKVAATYERLAAMIADGTIHTPVAATFPISQAPAALAAAEAPGRDGKVLLTMG